MSNLNKIPSIEYLLNNPDIKILIKNYGRDFVIGILRETLQEIRSLALQKHAFPDEGYISNQAQLKIEEWIKPTLVPVINATGIILHTNLGRAPLSKETIDTMHSVADSYSNLEFDLEKGKRGKRSFHAENLLTKITGAESALVVNNNAAAVLLVLSTLANRKRVIISRTQLVEIGGGFRVPDVMKQSGAKLVSIGTTNRVHLNDYKEAISESAALILCAHHSNFRIIGFTTEPEIKQIAELAQTANIPLVYDLGSGALLDTKKYGLAQEPTVQQALKDSADIVCFSGDKLLGGPQAGIIVGKKVFLEKIKKHPLARAVRADKICLSGTTATLLHYLKGEAEQKIPVWMMISANESEIKRRAKKIRDSLQMGSLTTGLSMIGGGSLPGETLPTILFSLQIPKPNSFLSALRKLPIPIIARIESKMVVFDPRTILPSQEAVFIEELQKLMIEFSNIEVQ